MEGISIKAFVGIQKDGDVKIQLQHSMGWNRDRGMNTNILSETVFDDKEYIGMWMNTPLGYMELKILQDQVISAMQTYCPKLNMEKHPVVLFSQIFAS